MTAAIKAYLVAIEQALKAGNATEHTHRPALKRCSSGWSPLVAR